MQTPTKTYRYYTVRFAGRDALIIWASSPMRAIEYFMECDKNSMGRLYSGIAPVTLSDFVSCEGR